MEKQEGQEGAEFTRKRRQGPVGMARRTEEWAEALGTWGKVGSIPQRGRSKAGPGEVRHESEVPGELRDAAPQLRRVVEARAMTSGKNRQLCGGWGLSAENAESDAKPGEQQEFKCMQGRGAGKKRTQKSSERTGNEERATGSSGGLSGKRETL